MIEIGKINHLTFYRETDSGFYLKDQNSDDEVFMPPAMAPSDLTLNQEIDAFVYLDTRGGRVATDKIPLAEVGEYALMRVIDVQDFGAFFDWGIEKDLLVPGNEQKEKVRLDQFYLVRICLEEETNRIYGTTKLGKYIETSVIDFTVAEKIKIVRVISTELGYRSIINKKYIGMIYSSEIFVNIEIGKTYDGVVKNIRPDGLIDAALQVQGIKNLVQAKQTIIEMLKKYNGNIPLSDKSSSDAIKKTLGMSKQTFKRAIGMLYKDRLIKIKKDGIELL